MIGWTTVSSIEDARKLASGALEARLCACVQISAVESTYVWKGAVQTEAEMRLTLKFDARCGDALRDWLKTNHPYETPQWVAVEAADALPVYADWISESCRSD